MKQRLALSLIIVFMLMVCNVPTFSESTSEDPYKVYSEYKHSLFMLQQDIARIYLELQGKNPQAVYEHMLQSIESTATLIGKAEIASQNVHDGLQISLQAQLNVFFLLGFTKEQKTDLLNVGYTEEDIDELLKVLAYCDDHNYHAITGFSTEEVEWFRSWGLTDEQITELQASICDNYTKIRTNQELVKEHQSELLYIQIILSLAALQTLTELDDQKKNKDKSELHDSEEKLLEAISNISKDHSSLEKVKTFSKQTYKAAEQEIHRGNEQFLADFFIGLQIHCGALTALNGDPEFGLAEIRLYEGVLSECMMSSERSAPYFAQAGGQSAFQDAVSKTFLRDIGHVPSFLGQAEEPKGQVEESDETNNAGWITVLVKASDSSDWSFWKMVYVYIVENLGQIKILEKMKDFLTHHIGDAAASYVINAGGVILTIIANAPGIGETWIDSIPYDPAGIFTDIIEDKDTIKEIERGAKSGPLCRRQRYAAVLAYPGVIVYTIMCAEKIYKSPWDSYFYFMRDEKNEEWIVEVQDMKYGLGRVVQAHKVGCGDLECFNIQYTTIYEMWESCLLFTPVWERSQLNIVWI